jgi:hypothetical protein
MLPHRGELGAAARQNLREFERFADVSFSRVIRKGLESYCIKNRDSRHIRMCVWSFVIV